MVETPILSSRSVALLFLGRIPEALEAAWECVRDAGASTLFFGTEAALALAAGGELDRAREILRRVLGEGVRTRYPLLVNHGLCCAGAAAHLLGRNEPAAKLLAAARTIGGAADSPVQFRTPTGVVIYSHYRQAVRAALDADTAHRARDAGRAMTTDEAVAFTLEEIEAW